MIGTPVAGRTRVEIEPLIGFFVNTLAIRVRTGGGTTVGELLERTREQVLRAQENQDLTVRTGGGAGAAGTYAGAPAGVSGDVCMAERPGREIGASRVGAVQCRAVVTTAQFELTLELAEGQGGIQGTLNYATALFERATMERYVEIIARHVARDGSRRPGSSVANSADERGGAASSSRGVERNGGGVCERSLLARAVRRAGGAGAGSCGGSVRKREPHV